MELAKSNAIDELQLEKTHCVGLIENNRSLTLHGFTDVKGWGDKFAKAMFIK